MKILFVGATTSNHTIRWVNVLAQRGHDVLLISRGDQRDEAKQISPKVRIEYLRFGGGLGYYLNVPQAKRIYKKFKPDVVNAHYATGYGTLSRLAKFKPLVLSCWGSDIFEFPKESYHNRRMLEKNLDFASAVASTSVSMAEEAKQYLRGRRKITVTPFGVDTELFSPKKTWKLNKKPVIGIVKYLKPIYDIPLLIKAFSLVCKKSDYDPVLKIYGGGPLLKDLKKLASDLKVSKNVHFYDTIPNTDVPDVIKTFDIFVNCSKAESFGVAVVEAMSCELPVVVTPTAGFSEVVENEINGIVLKDRNPKTMAYAILKLLDDEKLREKFGKSGRKRVERLYDWNKNVDTMINLYEKVRAGERL